MTNLSEVAKKTKAIRAELKASFPGHKFSVTCKNYSMGSSFRVAWLDGVTEPEVKAITNKYIKIFRCKQTGEILSGGNTYDYIERSYSPAVMQPELDLIIKKYNVTTWEGEQVTKISTRINDDGSMCLTDNYVIDGDKKLSLWRLLHDTLAKTSYYQKPENKN
jgi:hypothetical protein